GSIRMLVARVVLAVTASAGEADCVETVVARRTRDLLATSVVIVRKVSGRQVPRVADGRIRQIENPARGELQRQQETWQELGPRQPRHPSPVVELRQRRSPIGGDVDQAELLRHMKATLDA